MTTPLMLDPSVMTERDMRMRRPTQAVQQAPGLTSSDEGYTRQVQGNELAADHLTRGLDQGGRYITNARGRGTRAAAARGMGNSSLAAGAAESAAIDAYAPIALSDADAYRQAAGQNLDSLSRQRISDEGNSTQRYVSDNSTGAQIRIANANIEADRERQLRDFEESGRDRTWRTSEREGEQNWRAGEAERDRRQETRENRRATRAGVGAGLIGMIAQNPEYFRDPQGAAGAVEFYLSEWDRLYGTDDEGGG